MNAVGRIGSYIYRGVGTVSGPFHPFGGAIDIIVVEQPDGTFKSSPWYVRFGKFQGVLKTRMNVISIDVNGIEAGFNMYLAHTGQAYFLREVDDDVVGEGDSLMYPLSLGDEGDTKSSSVDDVRIQLRSKSCNYDSGSPRNRNGKNVGRPGILGFVFGGRSDRLSEEAEEGGGSGVERVSSIERAEIAADLLEVKWSTNLDTRIPLRSLETSEISQFLDQKEQHYHERNGEVCDEESASNGANPLDLCEASASPLLVDGSSYKAICNALSVPSKGSGKLDVCVESTDMETATEPQGQDTVTLYALEIERELSRATREGTSPSLQDENRTGTEDTHDSVGDCEDSPSMASHPQSDLSEEEQFAFSDLDERKPDGAGSMSSASPDTVNVNVKEIFDKNAVNHEKHTEKPKIVSNPINIHRNAEYCRGEEERRVESLPNMQLLSPSFDADRCQPLSHSLGSKAKTLKLGSRKDESKAMIPVDRIERPGDDSAQCSGGWKIWPFSLKGSRIDDKIADPSSGNDETRNGSMPKPVKKTVRALTPTSEELASLNLKEGRNAVTFTFSTNVLGTQKVDARIYLWKWSDRIVVSDVDGTITRSDVLGQFMPLVGIDWSQTGVTHLFSAIKENGYHLIFLSARAISQASVTRQFLVNLKQDGKALPDGPVVISPDGLFPSLFREVIRRAPHEFKIACLEEIQALFPPDHSPFYAGFGNRDTDEISYLKVGIPRGKIFIINPKGQVAVNRRVDTRSYTSLHDLVNGMFPASASSERVILVFSSITISLYSTHHRPWNRRISTLGISGNFRHRPFDV